MEKRITLKDVARKLGVHHTTVSRALRNSPRLPPATRQKIQAAARALGYRVNAAARALVVHRQIARPPVEHGALALLADAGLAGEEGPVSVLMAARRQAARLGYQIDIIDSHAPGLDGRKLTRILKARGIDGLLVLPPRFDLKAPRRLRLDWPLFSAVILGHGLFWPHLHRVDDDHFGNARQLTRKLISLGYRRIGLCMGRPMATLHAGGGWEGGYLIEMKRLGECPPVFWYESVDLEAPAFPAIRDWVLRERLDAIMMDNNNSAIKFAWKGGFPIPEKLGIASLTSFNPQISGIHPPFERVWTTAVDFLVHLIHSNQRGIPEFPQRLLLEGAWVPGKTVRRMNREK